MRRRVHQLHETELADSGQPTEFGRVDDLPNAGSERHVELRRNPNQVLPSIKLQQFRNVAKGAHRLSLG